LKIVHLYTLLYIAPILVKVTIGKISFSQEKQPGGSVLHMTDAQRIRISPAYLG